MILPEYQFHVLVVEYNVLDHAQQIVLDLVFRIVQMDVLHVHLVAQVYVLDVHHHALMYAVLDVVAHA